MKNNVIATLFLLLLSNLVLAHSNLKKSSPADGEMLKASPDVISLTFLNPVKLIKFKLVSANQDPVNTDFKPSMMDRSEFRITPEKLSQGKYTVYWAIMGVDGHKMNGDYQFEIMKMSKDEDQKDHHH